MKKLLILKIIAYVNNVKKKIPEKPVQLQQ